MKPKPDHLGPEYAAQFADPTVVAHYGYRPTYPDAVVDILRRLIGNRPSALLDVGTGTGEIARRMAGHVDRIDAVDPSIAMIAEARKLPGGDSNRITWRVGMAETAPLDPPYSLITAGASLHWMEWSIVLPRFRDILSPDGVLAIVDITLPDVPWEPALPEIISRYSTNRLFRPYDVIEEIEGRGLFTTLGRAETAPVPFLQSVSDYVASFHARNGFSLDRMTSGAAEAFDQDVATLVAPHATDGHVTLPISGVVVWGIPAPRPDNTRLAGCSH